MKVEHCSGGAFLAQSQYLYRNFNMQLFDLYDRREGKGEDGILTYTVSKSIAIYYCADQLFWHNDQGDSVYSSNHFRYNKIVASSRAYLNYEYHRLNNISLYYAQWGYFNYSFWRSLGLLLNFLMRPTLIRWHSLAGYFVGWRSGSTLKFDSTLIRNDEWHERALLDVRGSK